MKYTIGTVQQSKGRYCSSFFIKCLNLHEDDRLPTSPRKFWNHQVEKSQGKLFSVGASQS